MGENQWATRAAVALIALLTLGYFALQAGRYFSDPFSTTLTYRYEVEESMELSGYVVRQEQGLAGEDSPLLRPSREEGERVSAGGVVAVVYADQASLDLKAEAEADASRLEQLYYAQDMEQGVETVSRLDGQILARLTEYRAALAAKRLDRANEQGTQIRALVLKRDYSHDSPETLSEEIAALESRLEELEAISERVTRNITAPASGLYSAVTDGYERILTPEAVREMTPTAFAAALDTERPETQSVGKLIFGDAWYYAVSLSVSEAEEIRTRVRGGASLYLRFSKNVERDFPVTLDSVSEEEGGRVIVLFRCVRYLPEVTLLRKQKAEVIFGKAAGLRAPKEALRMIEEDGERVTGIYCVVGTEARFKPVEVVYTGDTFLLVRSTAERESLRLRAGDELIVRAENLYNGKVVAGGS